MKYEISLSHKYHYLPVITLFFFFMADLVPVTLIYNGSSVYLKDSSNYVYI